MGDIKSNNFKLLALAGVAFVVLLIALFVSTTPPAPPPAPDVAAQTAAPPEQPPAAASTGDETQAAPEEMTAETKSEDIKTGETKTEAKATGAKGTDYSAAAPAPAGAIDVNAALSDRILGNTSAPIRIAEHASFSCVHCAHFHKETFALVKKNYIDTGKAYLVFSDFPLDQGALTATMLSRCLPQDKYWAFVSMLFEKQEDWAHSADYLTYLKNAAIENGLTAGQVEACLASKELQEGIQNRMKGVAQQWNINSTPSFVINNKTTHAGAIPYADFGKILDEELKKVAGFTKDQKTKTNDKPASGEAAAEPPRK